MQCARSRVIHTCVYYTGRYARALFHTIINYTRLARNETISVYPCRPTDVGKLQCYTRGVVFVRKTERGDDSPLTECFPRGENKPARFIKKFPSVPLGLCTVNYIDTLEMRLSLFREKCIFRLLEFRTSYTDPQLSWFFVVGVGMERVADVS